MGPSQTLAAFIDIVARRYRGAGTDRLRQLPGRLGDHAGAIALPASRGAGGAERLAAVVLGR